ncbi:MAG TPA: FtsL-like putative cell division protein [Puia sp.]|nr:FtsL-like putative cell division protein [Puia sp.]
MSEESQVAESSKSELKRRYTHRWMVKNVPFFLFLALLAIIYIYNGHYADKSIREIGRAQTQLKELQYEYKTLRSEVMFRSKESELAKAVEVLGLRELTAPAVALPDTLKKP